MDRTTALLALLHLLVPIYWLGGDLGAFYSARLVVDARRAVNERLLALAMLNAIDMAPRTALILALPTGLALAVAKGWIVLASIWLVLLWGAALLWLALAWAVHLRHAAGAARLRQIDLAVRYGVLLGLLGVGVAGLGGVLAVPLFIALKSIVLALCIAAGLVVRVQLGPLIPAAMAMKAAGATPATDATISAVLARTTPLVLAIWGLVLLACLLGLAIPI